MAPPRDLAALALRLGLGSTFAMVGWDHTFGGHGVITDALRFLPDPEAAAMALSVAELGAGVLLLAGLALPLALAVTLLVNVGALLTFAARGTFLYADVAMVGVAVALLATGPGAHALQVRLPEGVARPLAAHEHSAWRALRALAALTLLAGAALAVPAGVDGYEAIDARVGLGPLAVLAGAVAGALLLLGLAPWAAVALVLLVEGLALAAFGARGGFTGYLAFQPPIAAATLALALAGPVTEVSEWLSAQGARRGAPRGALAAGAAVLLVAATLGAGTGLPGEVARPVAQQSLPWTLRTAVLGEGGQTLGEGEAWVGQVPVRSLVLREMVATLTWEDDAPGSSPDEFTLELVPPAGLMAGPVAEGSSGTLEIRMPVYRTPPPRGPELGVGQWSVRVYLRSAGDASTLGVLPGLPDEGNAFALNVSAVVFELVSP